MAYRICASRYCSLCSFFYKVPLFQKLFNPSSAETQQRTDGVSQSIYTQYRNNFFKIPNLTERPFGARGNVIQTSWKVSCVLLIPHAVLFKIVSTANGRCFHQRSCSLVMWVLASLCGLCQVPAHTKNPILVKKSRKMLSGFVAKGAFSAKVLFDSPQWGCLKAAGGSRLSLFVVFACIKTTVLTCRCYLSGGWWSPCCGSSCRSVCPCGCRCCSSGAHRSWTRWCRMSSAAPPCWQTCCQTGCGTGSSDAVTHPGPAG